MPAHRCLISAVIAVAVLAAPASADALLGARGAIHHAYVAGAKPGQRLVLDDARGARVAAGRADRLGSKIFRELAPGRGYRVRRGASGSAGGFAVLAPGGNPPRVLLPRPAAEGGPQLRDGCATASSWR